MALASISLVSRVYYTHAMEMNMRHMKTIDRIEPAYIEIVFEDHEYTATVHEPKQLERFCADCVRQKRPFRFGRRLSYGTLNLEKLSVVIERIKKCGSYNSCLRIERMLQEQG